MKISEYGAIPSSDVRTIDSYLEDALQRTNTNAVAGVNIRRLKYYGMVLVLGSVNTVSAVLYSNSMYLLADKSFQSEILHNDYAKKGAFLSGISLLGMLVGGMIAPCLVKGRKPMVLLGLFGNFCGSIIMAVSPSYSGLVFGRCISGIGTGLSLPAVTSLITELSPQSQRGALVALVDSHWTVGFILLAMMALIVFGYLQLSWRVFLVVCSLSPLVSLILVQFFVVESPRHLAIQGFYTEAANAVNYVAQLLDCNSPRTCFTRDEEEQHVYPAKVKPLTILEIHHHVKRQIISEGSTESPSIILQTIWLFQGHQRQNTITLLFLWLSLSSVGSLGLWLTAVMEKLNIQHLYISSLITAVVIVPGNIVAISLLDRIGRTKVFLTSMTLLTMSLAYFSFLASQDVDTLRPAQIVICVSLYNSLLSCCWNAVMVMTGELFPTELRYAGLALCATAGRLCSFSSQFWNGALMSQPSYQLLVACGISTFGVLIAVLRAADDMTLLNVKDLVQCENHSVTNDDCRDQESKS